MRVRIVRVAQIAYHACAVGLRSVLTHFPFAAQGRDREFESYNKAQHFVDVWRRGIIDLPVHGARRFMRRGQSLTETPQPAWILDKSQRAAAVHHGAFPCWHDLAA